MKRLFLYYFLLLASSLFFYARFITYGWPPCRCASLRWRRSWRTRGGQGLPNPPRSPLSPHRPPIDEGILQGVGKVTRGRAVSQPASCSLRLGPPPLPWVVVKGPGGGTTCTGWTSPSSRTPTTTSSATCSGTAGGGGEGGRDTTAIGIP